MFASKQPNAARPAWNGAQPMSIIGSEVIISGDVATDAQLHVDGRIDGNVRCTQLIQGADGIISGNIVADEARLAGTVEGTVSAAMLTIEATARILGDIAYDTIGIEAGARIEGRLGRRAASGLDGSQPQLIATPVSFSPSRASDSGLVALSDPR